MKHRQTFTIEPEVSNRARIYARSRDMSLSSLVEQLLREKTSTEPPLQPPSSGQASFAQRWKGRGALTDRDDARSLRLRKKYRL